MMMYRHILTLSTTSFNQCNLFGSGRPINLKKFCITNCAGPENPLFTKKVIGQHFRPIQEITSRDILNMINQRGGLDIMEKPCISSQFCLFFMILIPTSAFKLYKSAPLARFGQDWVRHYTNLNCQLVPLPPARL